MKGQDNRKYAIYSRKSKFTGKGESIENHCSVMMFRIPSRKKKCLRIMQDSKGEAISFQNDQQ